MIGWFNIAAHTRRAEAGQVVDRQGVSIVVRGGGGKHSLGVSSPHTNTPPPVSIFFINLALLIDLLYSIGILIYRRQTQNSNVQILFYTTNKSKIGLL